jgi:hypothetical protein
MPLRRVRAHATSVVRARVSVSSDAAVAARSSSDVSPILVVEPQCRLDWCWAAVAVSVARVRGGNPAAVPTQCAFAYRELHAADLPVTPALCCGGDCDAGRIDDCSAAMELDDALESLGCLAVDAPRVIAGAPDEELLIRELTNGRPVCGRISRGGAVGHFGVVVGMYTEPTGNRMFLVSDPIYEPGSARGQSIDQLRSNYMGKGGSWDTSYRTT